MIDYEIFVIESEIQQGIDYGGNEIDYEMYIA